VNLRRQAEQDVNRILTANGSDLATIRSHLDTAVQDADGYWEVPNPDFASIDGGVRAAHIRQLAAGLVDPRTLLTLRLRIGRFSAFHLLTPDGWTMRTRKRPTGRKTGKPMRPAGPGSQMEPLFEVGGDSAEAGETGETLFGYDPSTRPYEISILMDIDLATGTLKAAYLAAIDWGEDDNGREIYYEAEIPAQPMQGRQSGPDGTGSPSSTPSGWKGPQGSSGFEEFLHDEGEGTGQDPA
jgi:hypothetical protein